MIFDTRIFDARGIMLCGATPPNSFRSSKHSRKYNHLRDPEHGSQRHGADGSHFEGTTDHNMYAKPDKNQHGCSCDEACKGYADALVHQDGEPAENIEERCAKVESKDEFNDVSGVSSCCVIAKEHLSARKQCRGAEGDG